MVKNVIDVLEPHCIESKSSKRLFIALNKCQNFLQALKMVDTFIMTERILVPMRFSFLNFSGKESRKEIVNEAHTKSLEQPQYPKNHVNKSYSRLSPMKNC